MTDEREWGPWIEHDGKGCPSGINGRFIFIVFRCGDAWSGIYGVSAGNTYVGAPIAYTDNKNGGSSWRWGTYARHWEVIRYRIRRPRALLDLIDMVESLPAPAKEGVTV